MAQVGLAIEAVRLAGSLGIEERPIRAAVRHGSGAGRALGIVTAGGTVESVPGRLGDLMRKDVTVVREVARSAGADLGVIGTVLSSEAVHSKVLRTVLARDSVRAEAMSAHELAGFRPRSMARSAALDDGGTWTDWR